MARDIQEENIYERNTKVTELYITCNNWRPLGLSSFFFSLFVFIFSRIYVIYDNATSGVLYGQVIFKFFLTKKVMQWGFSSQHGKVSHALPEESDHETRC